MLNSHDRILPFCAGRSAIKIVFKKAGTTRFIDVALQFNQCGKVNRYMALGRELPPGSLCRVLDSPAPICGTIMCVGGCITALFGDIGTPKVNPLTLHKLAIVDPSSP